MIIQLPVRAMELGREFQNACVSRFEGEEVDPPITLRAQTVEFILTYKLDQVANLQSLGEKTLQAIGTPQGQTGKHECSSTASMARMPVDPDSILEDGGSAAFTGGQFPVSILKLLLVKHNDSKYMYNRCLANRKWPLRNSNLHSNSSGKKSLSSSTLSLNRLHLTPEEN